MIQLQNFTSTEDVKTYLKALRDAGRLYHLDDNPEEIAWADPICEQEQANISTNDGEMHAFCDVNGLEIWDYFPEDELAYMC